MADTSKSVDISIPQISRPIIPTPHTSAGMSMGRGA